MKNTKYNFSAKLRSEIARKVLETQVDGRGSSRLFLQEQIHVIDAERSQLLVGPFEVKQQSAKGDKNSPVCANRQ